MSIMPPRGGRCPHCLRIGPVERQKPELTKEEMEKIMRELVILIDKVRPRKKGKR